MRRRCRGEKKNTEGEEGSEKICGEEGKGGGGKRRKR